MLKRCFLATLTLLILVGIFAGCSNEPALNPADYVIVAENGSTEYVLVNCGMDAVDLAKFSALLKKRMGTQIKIVNKAPETGKGIFVGVADKIEEISEFSMVESYAHYSIRVDESGNLYVFTTMKEMLTEAMSVASGLFVEVKQGMFGFRKDTNLTAGVSGVEEPVPIFDSKNAVLDSELYHCANGDTQLRYNQVGTLSEVEAYVTELEQAGFTYYTGNSAVGNNLFATYVKGNTLVHINYFAKFRQLNILFGVKGHLLSNKPMELTAEQKVVVPSITQMSLSNTGLSMVLQLADGSFYIIDGGRYDPTHDGKTDEIINEGAANQKEYSFTQDTAGDLEKLWALIQANTPAGQRPQITWMITHADTDHIDAPVQFIKTYAGQFDLNQVCYNFPNDGAGVGFVETVKKHYPNAGHYVMHTGDTFYLPGNAQLEILCAVEDLEELKWDNWNLTSAAWRFTVEGKTILITGDTETAPNNKMHQTFGKYLKSDVYQVPHHGANGGVLAMNKAVNPSICFWAVSQEKFENDNRMGGTSLAKYDHTQWLRKSAAVKAHYHQSETVTLELPSLARR
jgi:hypothetical protein